MAYRSADRKDRWKAMLAAIGVTGLLGAGVLTGLNVEMVRHAVDHLQTFDIELPKPPPPEPPPPLQPNRSSEQEGAPAAPKPSPIVAPKPEVQLPVKETIAAATKPGTGASSASGFGGVGSGTGAGGTGNGTGRGSGDGAGFTPAQRISKVPNSEYRRLVRVSGINNGRVGISVRVETDGRATNCRVIAPSGSPTADSLMCELTERYVRFRPALDPQGRPVAQEIRWYPNWSPR